MSTIVCHSILVEPSSLSLKLNPPIPPPQCIDPIHTGWSSIEALSNASNLHHLGVYVHPLDKRSTSTVLSEKSLEMCTENLGSETGTDTTDDDIFSIMSFDSETEELTSSIATKDRITMIPTKPRHNKMGLGSSSCRKAGYESLPPPLTTTIRVQPHRESGRLVMMAVAAAPRRPSIHAERSNGRLTMSLMEEFFEDDDDDDNEEEYEEKESVKEVGLPKKQGNEEDTDGNNKEVGDKYGIGELQRLSRCNEGGRGSRRFINWETFWVAT